jgi:hypothetical protein
MLTHDPITIPHELLKGRGSERLETTTLLIQQRVSFAEHEANTGSIRLSLVEFAPYVCSPCSVERYIIRMSRLRIEKEQGVPIREPLFLATSTLPSTT